MLFVVALAIGLFSPVFLAATNVSNVFRQCAFLRGRRFRHRAAHPGQGPDLSIGAVMGLSGIIFGLVVQAGGSWFTGLLLAILAAAAIGAVNGVINAVIRLRSILLTVLFLPSPRKRFPLLSRVVALVLAGPLSHHDGAAGHLFRLGRVLTLSAQLYAGFFFSTSAPSWVLPYTRPTGLSGFASRPI